MSRIIMTLLALSISGCTRPVYDLTGRQGPAGPQGPAGINGASPTFQTRPATVEQCPTGGTEVISGYLSDLGQIVKPVLDLVLCNGATGATGATGAAGAAGTVITPVQLCSSSFVPSYPSTFPEVALCIDGVLYGVYSANGGFLTEVTPGTYSSDGINASCTFTVGPNCAVGP